MVLGPHAIPQREEGDYSDDPFEHVLLESRIILEERTSMRVLGFGNEMPMQGSDPSQLGLENGIDGKVNGGYVVVTVRKRTEPKILHKSGFVYSLKDASRKKKRKLFDESNAPGAKAYHHK